MGRRRRAAAIASPSRVCAFSRTRSLSSSAWKVARSTAAGRLGVSVVPTAGDPMFFDSSFMMTSSCQYNTFAQLASTMRRHTGDMSPDR